MKELFTAKNIKQFLSYFGVGGAAALVEWGSFSLLEYVFNTPYLLATIIAFVIATIVNWILGRIFTFKESAYTEHRTREFILVFLVSSIGLGFNLLLMYIFVSIFHMDSNLLKTVSKALATGIVFIWNFFSRKMWIYKESTKEYR